MKKFFTLLLLTLSLSASANLVGESDNELISAEHVALSEISRPIFLQPTCIWNMANGQCNLTNCSGQDVVCHFYIQARSARGSMYNNYQYRILYRGMTATEYVYANNPAFDPIVYMNATAQCNTIR